MFSDNLSVSLLKLCDIRNISYEAASELCELCTKEFGNLARGNGNPTLRTFEKLCTGFKVTPNELLLLPNGFHTAALPITEIRCLFLSGTLTGFPVCPHCGTSLEREFQAFCDRCGQLLDWHNYCNARLIYPQK